MPFIKTAYVASGGSARQSKNEENINHYGAVRLRVTGTGTLKQKLYSLDNVITQTMANKTMSSNTNIQPTTLCNFIQQRAAYELKTTEINEYFRVNRIIIFAKEIWTSYPGTT